MPGEWKEVEDRPRSGSPLSPGGWSSTHTAVVAGGVSPVRFEPQRQQTAPGAYRPAEFSGGAWADALRRREEVLAEQQRALRAREEELRGHAEELRGGMTRLAAAEEQLVQRSAALDRRQAELAREEERQRRRGAALREGEAQLIRMEQQLSKSAAAVAQREEALASRASDAGSEALQASSEAYAMQRELHDRSAQLAATEGSVKLRQQQVDGRERAVNERALRLELHTQRLEEDSRQRAAQAERLATELAQREEEVRRREEAEAERRIEYAGREAELSAREASVRVAEEQLKAAAAAARAAGSRPAAEQPRGEKLVRVRFQGEQQSFRVSAGETAENIRNSLRSAFGLGASQSASLLGDHGAQVVMGYSSLADGAAYTLVTTGGVHAAGRTSPRSAVASAAAGAIGRRDVSPVPSESPPPRAALLVSDSAQAAPPWPQAAPPPPPPPPPLPAATLVAGAPMAPPLSTPQPAPPPLSVPQPAPPLSAMSLSAPLSAAPLSAAPPAAAPLSAAPLSAAPLPGRSFSPRLPADTADPPMQRLGCGVLIGVDYLGTAEQLAGCGEAAAALSELCLRKGFAERRLLSDAPPHGQAEEPCRGNIMDALRWLPDSARRRGASSLFLGFVGRCVALGDGREGEPQGEALLPSDFRATPLRLVTDEMLFRCCVGAVPSGVRLTVLTDCGRCPLDLPFALAAQPDGTLRRKETTGLPPVVADVLILSAQSPATDQPDHQGALTRACVQALDEGPPRASCQQLLLRIHHILRRTVGPTAPLPQVASSRNCDFTREPYLPH